MNNQQQSQGTSAWQQLAAQPEKVLGYTWLLFLAGLLQRFVLPLAGSGVLVIMPMLVMLVAVLPALMTALTLHYNKTLTDKGKAWLISSAAIVSGFGLYLFAWAI
jgi:hypothetical protein